MARPTDDSHFPSTMNIQDLLDMSNAVPEECATSLPNASAHRTLTHRGGSNHNIHSVTEDPTSHINYDEPMHKKIGSMLKSNVLADVTLIVGVEKKHFHAHKLILSLASPVFTAMFYGQYKNDAKKSFPAAVPVLAGAAIAQNLTHHNLRPSADSSIASIQAALPPPFPPSWQAASIVEIPDCTPEAMQEFLQVLPLIQSFQIMKLKNLSLLSFFSMSIMDTTAIITRLPFQ